MTDSTVLVRPARLGDRDDVWPLARELATSFEPQRPAFEASFRHLLTTPRTMLLVAETAQWGITGYLLGSAHLTLFANGPVAWVEELMVDARSRRSGVGAALMRHAEDWARDCGAAYLALATRRAGAFYSALGYEDSAVFYRKLLA